MNKEQPKETWPIKIIRSRRRRKTVSGELKEGTLVIRAPAAMSEAELAPIIENLRERLQRKVAKRQLEQTDETLEEMAQELNQLYFDGRLQWQSIRFVTNQQKRFGSCTPTHGTIRISHRVGQMPAWVLKYVVMHEIAHLQEANHSPAFWELVNQYPLTERARGYLMATGLEEDLIEGE